MLIEKEKILFDQGKLLPLVEDFYSLQGEGYHTGKAAYFIRLGGCDIGCEWCDTKFSWNFDLLTLTPTDIIVKKASNYPAKAVVVTGGEPSLYNMDYLCKGLKKNKISTFIETSGTCKLTGVWDWVCLSPKMNKSPEKSNYLIANELKVIINNVDDLKWAEENAGLVNKNCLLFLQPEWSRYNFIINYITEYIKNNPQWRISLQAHKFMHIP